MKIKKYLHSCVVLEEGGKRLLFDPGAFVFIEERFKPEDIGPVDVVLITHTHGDHYFPEALKKIYSLRPFKLLVSQNTVDTMEKDGLDIPVEILQTNTESSFEGFSITTFDCPHEAIPIPCPHNMAYKINDAVYHPGDSYFVPENLGGVKILFLPNGGPWATAKQTVAFAEKVKPQVAIPIHDSMHKDFWLTALNASMAGWMKDRGVDYKILDGGVEIEI